jgi:divalent metal cation (Fe/Co/Zn/Cd) transporter
VLIWRLKAEARTTDASAVERLDRSARRLVGLSLFLLSAYVALDAGLTLWHREPPHPSVPGTILTTISIGVMIRLARAKRRVAAALGSRAMHAESFQTTACWWLSIIALTGMGLNAMAGWWWADPVAALGMTVPLVREGREAWRGEGCQA